jgi:hypothetical protein
MTTTWHADPPTLEAYATGTLDDVRASSLEAHLLACETCREGLAISVPATSLDRIWHEVVVSLDAPRPGLVERALVALRVPEHAARLLAATPSLRLSWLLAEVAALGFAVLAANLSSGSDAEVARFLFLVVAALLPVAGIAVAFGPGVDPTYEIGAAAPMRADVLLAMRACAVLTTSLVITGCAALAMPGLDASAAVWLLPSLGLTSVTLALGTWWRPFVAASAAALGWVAVVSAAAVATEDRLAAFRPVAQVACLLAIAVSAAVLVRRHTIFEEGIAT